MKNRQWIMLSVIGFVSIIIFGIFNQIINFNNHMIALQEMKKAELEVTKVEYGQCIIKIIEANKIAKSYRDDVLNLATKAGSNLEQFNKNLIALIGTQVIPEMSPNLRENVQSELISCRNAYVGRIDLGLKPMYTNFNLSQRQFPNNIYNAMFFHWQTEKLIVPKNQSAEEIFKTGEITPLELN